MIDFGGNLSDLPAGAGERLVMTTVRPVLPGRIRLTSSPAGTGWCRRPRPGRTKGYVVSRTAARPVLAGELLTEGDLEPAPWAVGDQVDVIPLSEPATRCGRCWACRLARALAWRPRAG